MEKQTIVFVCRRASSLEKVIYQSVTIYFRTGDRLDRERQINRARQSLYYSNGFAMVDIFDYSNPIDV